MKSVTLGIEKKGTVLSFTATQQPVVLYQDYQFQEYNWRVMECHDDGGYNLRFTDLTGGVFRTHHLLTDGRYDFPTPESYVFSS